MCACAQARMENIVDTSRYAMLDIKVDAGIATVVCGPVPNREADRGDEFSRCLRELARDDDVAVVVATGIGENFSEGDFGSISRQQTSSGQSQSAMFRHGQDLVNAHIELDKPFITALNGWAWGSGSTFALMADFIIAERQVRFGDGHIAIALAAGDGGSMTWPLSVGLIRAKKYLLTADWISAVEAEQIGLITEVVEAGESFPRAMELARRLADGPQTALRFTKRALNQWYRLGSLTSFDLSLALEASTFASEEAVEAVSRLKNEGVSAIGRKWRWRR
jgi:enoyl-CoA hydratase